MYPYNIYIQNYDELRQITQPDGNKAYMDAQFEIFDQRYGLKHNDASRADINLARAQYKHWRAVETGVPELLSRPDKNLLEENGFTV